MSHSDGRLMKWGMIIGIRRGAERGFDGGGERESAHECECERVCVVRGGVIAMYIYIYIINELYSSSYAP